ncbi:MAG: tetratricopeptide repeat protein, partial [Defluviicoccus sp.]
MKPSHHRRTAILSSVIALATLSLLLAGCAALDSGKGTAGNADAKYVQAMRMAESVRAGGDLPSASVFYNRAHEADPSQAAPLIGLAETAAALGSTEKAIELFREAMTRPGSDGAVRRKYAGLLLKSGKPTEALDAYREAVAIEPNDSRALNGIAVSLDVLGRPDESREVYTRALALAPHDAGIRSNLALSRALAGEHDAAVALLTQLAAEPSADARTRQNLALALALKGQIAEAAHTASRDLSEAELRNTLALYRSLARLPQQERAALVFGIAGRPGSSTANLAGLAPGDTGTARTRRRAPLRQVPAALAPDATLSEAETPEQSPEGPAAPAPAA